MTKDQDFHVHPQVNKMTLIELITNHATQRPESQISNFVVEIINNKSCSKHPTQSPIAECNSNPCRNCQLFVPWTLAIDGDQLRMLNGKFDKLDGSMQSAKTEITGQLTAFKAEMNTRFDKIAEDNLE